MPAVQTHRHEPLGLARIVTLFESAARRSLCRYVKKAMDANVLRVEFDATLDDVVDVNMRMVRHTATYGQQRSHSRWAVGVCAAGVLAVGILRGNAVPSYAMLAIASGAALIGGFAVAAMYGNYHDWVVSSNYRRIVNEMYGGAKTVHWQFEIQTDALWCRSPHGDVSFPWSRLVRVEDVPESIELWFNPGVAVVRDRAFRDDEERRAFLNAARSHLTAS